MEYLYAHFMGLDWERDQRTLKKLLDKDNFVNATMAVKLGLVDTIVPPQEAATNKAIKEEYDLIMKLNQMELDEIEAGKGDTYNNEDWRVIIKDVIKLREDRLKEKGQAPAKPDNSSTNDNLLSAPKPPQV